MVDRQGRGPQEELSTRRPTHTDWVAIAQQTSSCRRELQALSLRIADIDLSERSALSQALSQALDEHRERAFTHLLFASLAAAIPVDAQILERGARLLPSVGALAAVCGRLHGDVATALLTAVRGRGLGRDREPIALLVATLWAKRADISPPVGIIVEARVRARQPATEAGEDALVALRGLLDAPALADLVAPFASPEVEEAARALTLRLVEAMIGPALHVFPERPERRTRTRGPVRRAVARVGRNDACPCGSGKKYKLCHAVSDRERLASSSEVAGLTEDELDSNLAPHLTLESLGTLRGPMLARVDPEKLSPELRASWLERLGLWGFHEVAAAAVECWSRGGLSPEEIDAFAVGVAELAARDGQLAIIERMARVRGGAEGLLLEASLLATPQSERMARIEAIARSSVDERSVDLGFALFASGLPSLGIHVARAALLLRGPDPETDALYALMLEQRDRLELPPWDPVEEVLYTLEHGVSPELEQELLATRARLDRGARVLRATEDALALVKAELERRESAEPSVQAEPLLQRASSNRSPVDSDDVPQDPQVIRTLKERIELLKRSLRERHQERNALRRELEQLRAEKLVPSQADDPLQSPLCDDDSTDDGLDGVVDASVAARVRVPRFPEGFERVLHELPEGTSRAAMIRVGALCAGYHTAFREVRPLKGVEGVWRVKVGRSYRLLFRPREDTLEILGILHRQDLEKWLFRIRKGGEV